MAGFLLPAFGASTALENVDVTNMFVGEIVVDDAGQAWQLTVSTAALDSTHKAVKNVTGLRWVTYSASGASPVPAAAQWFNSASAWAQSLISTLVDVPFQSNCAVTQNEWEMSAASGSATTAPIPGSQGGVIKLATGATANSLRTLRGAMNNTGSYISNGRTSKYVYIALVRIVQTQASCEVDLIGITDNVTATINFGVITSASGTNYACKVGSAAAVDLGVAFDNNWHTVAIICDGTNVSFYVGSADGTSVSTLAMTKVGASQPSNTAANAGCFAQHAAQNLATTANVEMHLDSAIMLTEIPTNSM